jgi:hypothetical protein
MKKIEECLDLVLQSLITNGGTICVYEFENIEAYGKSQFSLSAPYDNLFKELGLNNKETKQLLEILEENDYISFEMVSGILYSTVYCKNKADNSVGNTNLDNSMVGLIGRPNRIDLSLKGKFFIQNGGYLGGLKSNLREQLLQKLAIWITAIGTGLGGLYLIGKALCWVCNHL